MPQSQEQGKSLGLLCFRADPLPAPPSPPRFDMPMADVSDPQPPEAEPEPAAPTSDAAQSTPSMANNTPMPTSLAGMTTIAEVEAGFRTVLGPMAMQLKVLSAQGRAQEAAQMRLEMNRRAQQFAEGE